MCISRVVHPTDIEVSIFLRALKVLRAQGFEFGASEAGLGFNS